MRSARMRSPPSLVGVARVPTLAFEAQSGHNPALSPRRSLPYVPTNTSHLHISSPRSPAARRRRLTPRDESLSVPCVKSRSPRKSTGDTAAVVAKEKARSARKLNDSMVYLDGPQIYACGHCRTHLTTHDEIISKSFHGRHGRAYLFDNCVNVVLGPPEDRPLITGLHSVCDIFCKRCNTLVGWTYQKAYEPSQKYKEGKFIIEKINLHLETSDYFNVAPPAGARNDRFRARSISWGSESSHLACQESVYEYQVSSISKESLY